jgi:2-polyprenyl-6-methoxyphenol hydroxylase-like FAD-dependent oxidoreductase
MSVADVVIVGGGLAGSLAAAMLGRRGYDVALVDPHEAYPPDFRAEKLDGSQVHILEKTGLATPILRAATHDRRSWVARRGRVVDRRPGDQHGILYDTLVNTVRSLIPPKVRTIIGKVNDLSTSDDRQQVTLAGGETLSARLVVVANGLNVGLRHKLGMTREDISPCHSIMLGFDVKPKGSEAFPFPALTYFGERPRERIAYITLFPIGSAMRANFSIYRSHDDPWLREFRKAPQATLYSVLPGLRKFLGDFEVPGFVQIRPADLYVTREHRRAGVVLIGDAFSTSCPGAGTGTSKVFTDVERLCNEHIPHWLATSGMDAEKIAQFYDDPVKVAADRASLEKAFWLRSMSTEEGLAWKARRASRFVVRWMIGTARRFAEIFTTRQQTNVGAPSAQLGAVGEGSGAPLAR